jgi:hypothetical protein
VLFERARLFGLKRAERVSREHLFVIFVRHQKTFVFTAS